MEPKAFPILALPYDVMMDVVANLDSLSALYNLLIAFPGLQPLVMDAFPFIVRNILTNDFQDPEMYRYLYAIMTARHHNPGELLVYFMTCFFTSSDDGVPLGLPEFIPRNMDTLHYMVEVLDGAQFYIAYGQRLWDCALINSGAHSGYPPASDAWIRLALLRIQLYAELFHQPCDTTDGVDNWEADLIALEGYWDYFASLPLFRMCKFLYTAIAVSVGHEIEYKWLPRMDLAPDIVCMRGLPQVRRFMQGKSYTSFGMGYVRQMVQRSAQSFEYLDPEAGMWDYKRAIGTVFGWSDGPHGGLGVTKRHDQYLYTSVPFHARDWCPVAAGFIQIDEDSEEGEGDGQSEE